MLVEAGATEVERATDVGAEMRANILVATRY